MAKLEHYFTRFEEGKFYHVYNRTVDKKPMFLTKRNHLFFLQQLKRYLKGVAKIYTHNLLDNHFHLIIKIPKDLKKYRRANKIDELMDAHGIVSKQFRRFFQSYALAFNKEHGRCGTLFQTPFKRVRIKDKKHLLDALSYVNINAQKHKLTANFADWEWCSYNEVLTNSDSKINKKIVSWFGSSDRYVEFHNKRAVDFDNL